MDNSMLSSTSSCEEVGADPENKIQLTTMVANGDEDGGKFPLDILPLEVWCLIFDNLTSFKDLASCSNASPVFRNELKPKSAQFLFEQVFPILIENGVFAPGELFNCLLPLRQVCRTWKAEVDSFLENHPCHSHLDHDNCSRVTNVYNAPSNLYDCFSPLQPAYTFSTVEDLRQCITYLQHLPARSLDSNPVFVGRSITFLVPELDRDPIDRLQYFFTARNLLALVGPNIWYCDIRNSDLRFTMALQLMPHLKVLKLSYKIQISNRPFIIWLHELPNLQFLKITMNKLSPVLPLLLDKYKLVKKLELDIGPSWHSRDGFFNTKRPNLEDISATVQSEEAMLQFGRMMLNTMPALRGVFLLLPNCSKFRDFGLIFSILESKVELPITRLKLTLQSKNVIQVEVRNRLNLPMLEELTIDIGVNVVVGNIDFISALKSLRQLTFIGRKLNDEKKANLNENREECALKFLRFQNRLYESNVWELLPKLDKVLLKIGDESGVVKSYYYERAAYENMARMGTKTNF